MASTILKEDNIFSSNPFADTTYDETDNLNATIKFLISLPRSDTLIAKIEEIKNASMTPDDKYKALLEIEDNFITLKDKEFIHNIDKLKRNPNTQSSTGKLWKLNPDGTIVETDANGKCIDIVLPVDYNPVNTDLTVYKCDNDKINDKTNIINNLDFSIKNEADFYQFCRKIKWMVDSKTGKLIKLDDKTINSELNNLAKTDKDKQLLFNKLTKSMNNEEKKSIITQNTIGKMLTQAFNYWVDKTNESGLIGAKLEMQKTFNKQGISLRNKILSMEPYEAKIQSFNSDGNTLLNYAPSEGLNLINDLTQQGGGFDVKTIPQQYKNALESYKKKLNFKGIVISDATTSHLERKINELEKLLEEYNGLQEKLSLMASNPNEAPKTVTLENLEKFIKKNSETSNKIYKKSVVIQDAIGRIVSRIGIEEVNPTPPAPSTVPIP